MSVQSVRRELAPDERLWKMGHDAGLREHKWRVLLVASAAGLLGDLVGRRARSRSPHYVSMFFLLLGLWLVMVAIEWWPVMLGAAVVFVAFIAWRLTRKTAPSLYGREEPF